MSVLRAPCARGCSGFTRSPFVVKVLGGKFTATHLISPLSPSARRQLADHSSLNIFKIIHASFK